MQGRIGQLQTFRSVGATSPQRVIRVGSVGDPIPIPRERRIESRDARKKRKELVRPHVKADEFASLFDAKSKYLFSIAAREGKTIGQRTVGKLDRLLHTLEEPVLHW